MGVLKVSGLVIRSKEIGWWFRLDCGSKYEVWLGSLFWWWMEWW